MKIWTSSTHFCKKVFLIPPQLFLFFKLSHSQLIQYTNIINHQRQEQLAVFSKSGSDIVSYPSLTPIKAFPSALFTSGALVLKHLSSVKLSTYTNYCEIVHKCRIYAVSSRNCSHQREPRAWRWLAQPGCKADPFRVSSLP